MSATCSTSAITRSAARPIEAIHLRCWAREQFHFAFLDDAGRFQVRGLADRALDRPTQPDYPVAHIKEGSGLARAPDASAVFDEDGPYLVAASVVLSDEDRVLAAGNTEAARAAMAPTAKKLRVKAIKEHADELVKKGVPKEAALRAAAKRFEAGTLLGSDHIMLDDGSEIAASMLLTPAGEAYDGRICFDPVEPTYDGGRPVGRIYWNEGMKPGVHSFAHGSKFWTIVHDAGSATAAIDEAGDNAGAIALALAHAKADVGAMEWEQLIKQAAKQLHLGIKRQPLRDSVMEQQQRIAAYTKEHATSDEAEARTGPMPLDTPLPLELFPRVKRTKDGIKVLDHLDNVEHMLDSYGLHYTYDVILKEIVWEHPGASPRR